MNFGFNSNVRVGDAVYHVQTEDRGPSHPFLDTVVYVAGRVVHKRSSSYQDLTDGAAKGEALVLFTTDPGLKREQLGAAAKSAGAPELAVPRVIQFREEIPLLGTGKTDYVQLKKLAEATAVAATAA